METKEITALNPWDGLVAVQEAILSGFRLSDANEHFPSIWQGQFQLTLVKTQQKVVEQPVPEVIEPVKPNPIVTELIEMLGEEQIGAAEVPPVPAAPARRGRKPAQ